MMSLGPKSGGAAEYRTEQERLRTYMVYEMKFEIDEPQFTQREVLGVIDLPATTVNTWIKRNLLEPFEFERFFGTEEDRISELADKDIKSKIRAYKVFHHDPSVRRMRLYSVLDTLCLAGIKAVLDANIEIRFAYQFPPLLCDWWTDEQLCNLNRESSSEEPIILYVDDGQLLCLAPPTPYRRLVVGDLNPVVVMSAQTDPEIGVNVTKFTGPNPHRVEKRDLMQAMRDAQLTSVTLIDWPSVEERVINGLKRIIGVRGHRVWDAETE